MQDQKELVSCQFQDFTTSMRRKEIIEVYPTLIFQYEFPGPAARKKSYLHVFIY